jgi:tetratricopeptide (TPR) repeat protein
LRERYAALLAEHDGDALVAWYAGLAEIVAAEHLVNARRPEEALVAYEACRDTFDAAVALESGYGPSAAWYSALAAAGAARIHAEAGRLAEAVEALEEAFERDGGALDAADGLGHTPRGILAAVATLVDAAGDTGLVTRVAALVDRD